MSDRDQLPSKEKTIAEMISVMESARDDGERNCQDLVRIHVGHICATISLLKELQQVRTTLTGISTCSTCEACRGAALRALGGEAPAARKPDKFDLAFEIMRQLDAENMETMQSCQFGYVMRVTRERAAQPPGDG